MKLLKTTLSLAAFAGIALCSAPQAAQAQTGAERLLGGLLSTGGYYFTSASATTALGTPKFFNQQAYYWRPASVGGFAIAGGFESITANDHFFPFTGGNSFNLIGPSARLTLPNTTRGLRPYLSVGLFYGQINSAQLGFNKSAVVPSFAIGVDYKINQFLSLSAGYRLSGQIGGIDTNGFNISLRIF